MGLAWVIVAPLVEAQAPELKHLRVSADDDPRSNGQRGSSSPESKPQEENRNADEYDRHACCEVQSELGSETIQRSIDRLRLTVEGDCFSIEARHARSSSQDSGRPAAKEKR